MFISPAVRNKILKYILYNLLVEPLIIMVYLPVQVYYLGLSNIQLVKWLVGSVPLGLITGIVISPVEMWLTRVLDRIIKIKKVKKHP